MILKCIYYHLYTNSSVNKIAKAKPKQQDETFDGNKTDVNWTWKAPPKFTGYALLRYEFLLKLKNSSIEIFNLHGINLECSKCLKKLKSEDIIFSKPGWGRHKLYCNSCSISLNFIDEDTRIWTNAR